MLVENELNKLNTLIISTLKDNSNNISDNILDYLTAKSKKLRPMLLFLFCKSLNIEITEEIYSLASAVELVHNSTLIHDDIIDEADTRRGRISLNAELGNGLSVLAGDILLASALLQLTKCKNIDTVNTFAQSLYNMCKGEINQNFTIGKILTMDDYIKKSEYKTAELFKAPLLSLCYLKDISEKDNIKNFAMNFGIAFQIKDDLLNIINTDTSKPVLSDIENGIYTAPVIYLNDEKNIEELRKEEIIELVQNKQYVNKTTELIKYYALKAISNIDFIQNNEYKQEIINITENLYRTGI